MMPKIKKWPLLILSIVFCELVGIVGSVFTISAIPEWYAGLNKPPFSPPNWLFGPVWTMLYALMGISFYLILISKSQLKRKAVKIFITQLGFNAIWSIIFFGFRNPALGMLDIVAMWVAIIMTIIIFRKISKWASYLLYPYLAWVTFASALNFSIWMLN